MKSGSLVGLYCFVFLNVFVGFFGRQIHANPIESQAVASFVWGVLF